MTAASAADGPFTGHGPITGRCHCGETGWIWDGPPGPITACNCTLCRRYGALWAYGFEDRDVRFSGAMHRYTRTRKAEPALEILFCPRCACVAGYRERRLDADGGRRVAVNIRMTSPAAVAQLPIDHFDGLDRFEDLPPEGKCVRDLWA